MPSGLQSPLTSTESPSLSGSSSVPSAAKWLGAVGLLPFIGLASASVVSEPSQLDPAAFALVAYGAVILSFLGGIHWGLTISSSVSLTDGKAFFRRLCVSVLPSLLGWGALFLPLSTGLFVLAAGFTLLLLYDLWASRAGQAPSWYPSLRLPLSLVVIVTLSVAAVFSQ